MSFILIDNYDSFTFNLFQMLQPIVSTAVPSSEPSSEPSAQRGAQSRESRSNNQCSNGNDRIRVFRNDEIDFDTVRSMNPTRIVLSPGPGHPANDSDFGVCKDIILRRKELGCAVLGVCLGHQGIAHHLGGSVVRAPEIVHGKSSRIRVLKRMPLFEGLPDVFEAMRYHSLVAQEEDLPQQLEVVARETESGLIMALRHKTEPLYGVQFHPESIGTPEGLTLLRNFVERC